MKAIEMLGEVPQETIARSVEDPEYGCLKDPVSGKRWMWSDDPKNEGGSCRTMTGDLMLWPCWIIADDDQNQEGGWND